MHPAILETSVAANGDLILIPTVPLNQQMVQRLWREIQRILAQFHPQQLVIDFQNILTIDSAGLALLQAINEHCRSRGTVVRYQGVAPRVERFLTFLDRTGSAAAGGERFRREDWVTRLGRSFSEGLIDARELVSFSGSVASAMAQLFTRAKPFRWREALYYTQLCGADAMPIVSLISFLMGLIMAFQAAVQLRQFGGNIFVADLLALAFTRELGPFLTAIILAGRSGSAFAAEIGTMKVNEEVDALTVMGFDITEFLVMPKIYAMALAGPLLACLSNCMGLLGGIVVSVIGLDLTVSSFLIEAYQILDLSDVLTGLAKSFAFSIVVGGIGCLRGLQTEQGADSVGRQTTSAVVSGIFLIIFVDAIFTVIFHVFDW
jgi:phospholipid/cholesterol/gamma-HCH transport system permease protein